MKQSQVLINFNGFHPSEFSKNYLNSLLEEISTESPTKSSIKATFSRKNQIFKGVIQISSAVGPFFAVATGTGLKEVSHKLLFQMRKRLSRWKEKRTRHRDHKKIQVLNLETI